jgi:HSP20 family protein
MSHRDIEVKRTGTRETERERAVTGWSYRPRVDVYDVDDELLVLADVPGAQPDKIDVKFEDGVLKIHAAVEMRQPAETAFIDHEYGVGHFDREIDVGNIIDPERIEAETNKGVLRIRLPKSASAKPRRIPVKNKS